MPQYFDYEMWDYRKAKDKTILAVFKEQKEIYGGEFIQEYHYWLRKIAKQKRARRVQSQDFA